jgi:selenocysteine lyase/cysteine desulfurase
MSLVANGLPILPGETILITDHEHAGGRTMWELQRDRQGAILVEVPLFGDEDLGPGGWKAGLLERFSRAFQEYGVSIVSFPLVTTSTGHILPAREICELAKENGAVSVIDAAQAFSVIPIDVQELDCDFLVVNGHKYLCGPVGSGFIVVKPRMLSTMESFWPTVVDETNYHLEPHPYFGVLPHRKGGLAPFTNIIPLQEALNMYELLGPEVVYKRLLRIGQFLREIIFCNPDVFELITPMEEGSSCVMTCFRPTAKLGLSSEEICSRLKGDYNIHVKHATEGGADAVRVAPHYYTTSKELCLFFSALAQITGVPITTSSISCVE